MSKWIEVKGECPREFSEVDYAWVRWVTGSIELSETCGLFRWGDITHVMPASEIVPPTPPKGNNNG